MRQSIIPDFDGARQHSELEDQNRVITVGVVGCGYWGPNLIRNFHNLSNCSLKIVCDRVEDRLMHMKRLYPEVETVDEFDRLINDDELDAIVIATPVKFHYELAKASLLAGKHVFIEKPMASSSAECEELNKIARENGLTIMVGHTFLYSSPVHKIRELVQSGDIGEIRYINSQRLNLGLFQKDINVAWDLAPHDISIILYILNENPDVVNCQGNAHITPGVHDVTNMSLGFPDGRFATIQSSWLEPRKVRQMTIVGTRRMIVYDDLEPLEKIRVYDVRVDRPAHYDTFAEFQYSYHHGDSYIPHLKLAEPLKSECEHFLECVTTGKRPLTCGENGLELVRILEASSKSLEAGGAPIRIAPTGGNGREDAAHVPANRAAGSDGEATVVDRNISEGTADQNGTNGHASGNGKNPDEARTSAATQ